MRPKTLWSNLKPGSLIPLSVAILFLLFKVPMARAEGPDATLSADTQTTATDQDGSGPVSQSSQDLTQVSLENLAGMDVVVTSSSKKAESLRDATSAIYVITQEDIQRSGAKTLPDLLIMV